MYLHLICFALAEQQARGAREAKRAQQRQVRGGEEQKRGVKAAAADTVGSHKRAFLHNLRRRHRHFYLYLYLYTHIHVHKYKHKHASMCVCVCIDVSKDVPAELETTTTTTTTRAKTSFARVLFPARTLFILVHTYKSVKRGAAAASPPLPSLPPLLTTALQRYTH